VNDQQAIFVNFCAMKATFKPNLAEPEMNIDY
jgi:hypothetical protein